MKHLHDWITKTFFPDIWYWKQKCRAQDAEIAILAARAEQAKQAALAELAAKGAK